MAAKKLAKVRPHSRLLPLNVPWHCGPRFSSASLLRRKVEPPPARLARLQSSSSVRIPQPLTAGSRESREPNFRMA
jgi:hypothetical protein